MFARSDALSHKAAWSQFAQNADRRFRRAAYNHYPRGRVVVRNGTAAVFPNRNIAVDEVPAAINRIFGLTAPKVHAEGGRHYECYIDKEETFR